jgi:hypothetical protein
MKPLVLFLSIFLLLFFTASLGLSQSIEIPLTVTIEGASRVLYFGMAPGMNRCLNSADVVNGHAEGELPPFPPQGVPEVRFVWSGPGSDPGCFGQGSANDFRPLAPCPALQRDTFKIKLQAGPTFTGAVSWPTDLGSYTTSAFLKYNGAGGAVTMDMMVTSTLDLSDLINVSDPGTITIYLQNPVVPHGIFWPDPVPPIHFGGVGIGNVAHQNFVLTNTGSAALNVLNIVSNNIRFNATPQTATIAPGGSQIFDITYAASDFGMQQGQIMFTHDGGGCGVSSDFATIAVDGWGYWIDYWPDIGVSFGNVFVLSSSIATFTVHNGSTMPREITGVTFSDSQFSLPAPTPTFPVTLAAGGEYALSVSFSPDRIGAISGSATISHNAGGPTLSVPLTGAGVAAFAVAPAGPLAFGNVVIGDVSAAQNLTVTNASSGAMNVSAVAPAGYNASPTGPVSIPGGGNQVFAVTFAPTALGADSGSVVFTHNGGGSPDSVSLVGVGMSQFTAEPGSLEFGTIFMIPPGTPVSQDIRVANNATSSVLNITGVTVADPIYSVFPTIATIPAGGSQVFTVTVAPATPIGGFHRSVLNFAYAGGPGEVPVSCFVTWFDGSRYVSITPDSLVRWIGNYYERPVASWTARRPTVPNWVNLLQQIVVRGGFAPNTTESDVKGGMVVGRSFMVPRSSGYLPARILRDTSWVRLSRWLQRNPPALSLGYGYQQIQNSLLNVVRGAVSEHDMFVRGIDSTKNPGDLRRVALKGEQSGIYPRMMKNKLFAELVALKVNIVSSQMGYTNDGFFGGTGPLFGQLVLNLPGSPFGNMSIESICAAIDTALTFPGWVGRQSYLDEAYAVLYMINRAFPTDIATQYNAMQWQFNKTLTIAGSVSLLQTPFLQNPIMQLAPDIITPSNDLFDSGMLEEEASHDFGNVEGPVAASVKISPNYPNPFNPSTTLNFTLFTDANVTLRVYNVLGQEVVTLLQDELMSAGPQVLTFDASGLSSGVYYYSITGQDLETGELLHTSMGKMLLVK